jgi:hypothetical protein
MGYLTPGIEEIGTQGELLRGKIAETGKGLESGVWHKIGE